MENRPEPMLRMSMGIMKGERRLAPVFVEENFVLRLGGVEAADAGAEEHPHPVAVNLVHVQARVRRA